MPTVQTTTQTPWSVQIPYLTEGFQAAQGLWNSPGPAYFPGSTVAPFSPDQVTSQNMIRDLATSGSPTLSAANNYATDVLSGRYLNSDPYGDSVFQNIQSHVMPAVNSQWMMSGRLGSTGYGDAMTRALTEAYSPWASQNYQFGLNQMSDMAKFAPDLRRMDYWDAGALGTSGQQQQTQAQSETQDAVNRWNYYQQLPYNKLSDFMSLVGGTNWGGTARTAQPTNSPSTLDQILGIGTGLLGSFLGGSGGGNLISHIFG